MTTFSIRLSHAISVCLMASTLVPDARAQVPPLGLDEAIALATARSHQLVAEEAAATAAREQAIAAGTPPDPVLKTGIDNIPIEGPHELNLTRDFMTMRSIGIEREVVGGAKRKAQTAFYLGQAEAAEAARSVALATLKQQTAAAWFDRLYSYQATQLLVAQRASADALMTAAEVAYGTGAGTQSDVLIARAAAARDDDAIAAMQREVAIARARLARWIGDDAALRPLAPPPRTDQVAVHHGNLEQQLALHPDIQLLLKREAVAAAEADIARSERRASWTVGVSYLERGSAFDDMVSISASRPLPLRRSQRQDRLIAASLATAAQARAEREEETRLHLFEAHSLIETWASNRARIERYANSLVPLAEERVVAASVAYRTGTGPLSEILDARRAVIDTRLEQLALEAESAKIWVELEYLIVNASSSP